MVLGFPLPNTKLAEQKMLFNSRSGIKIRLFLRSKTYKVPRSRET